MNYSESSHRHEVFWRIVAWVILIFVLLWASAKAQAQEQYIRACQSSYACQLESNASWAAGTRTYVFTPFQPNVSIRIFVHNNNTTSAHTAQTLTMWITNSTIANASLINQSDVWIQAALIQNSTTGASCLSVNANATTTPGAAGMGTCYSSGMYAAQVAIQFTPGGAQAGSPDTFDIGIVQQPSVYPGGPQPGAGEGNGSGIELSSPGTVFAAGNTTAYRTLNCFSAASQTTVTCLPVFGLGLVSSIGKAPAAAAVGNNGTGNDTVATGPLFAGTGSAQQTNAFMSAVYQSSANATQSGVSGSTLGGVLLTTTPASWTVPVQGASASACVAQLAAQAATRHCATGVIACVSATAAQGQLFANLRDGATGAGTIKWNGIVGALGIAGGSSCVTEDFAGGPICGTLNTAMTLELSAATAATNGCATTVKGYDVQ